MSWFRQLSDITAGRLAVVCLQPQTPRSVPRGIRSLGVLFVLPHLAFVAGSSSANEAQTSQPPIAIRANQTVLDLAIRGDALRVGMQSGRVEVSDRRTGDALAGLRGTRCPNDWGIPSAWDPSEFNRQPGFGRIKEGR